MSYVVVDIETTGLSKHTNKITEIGAVRIFDGAVVDTFQTLINPGVEIPRFITRLTGISNDMVADAPHIGAVMPKFLEFLGESTFVAHNATFDFGFLYVGAWETAGHTMLNPRLCTRKLASRLLPELSSKSLLSLCQHFGIVNTAAHRALADSLATADIFTRFVTMLADRNVVCAKDILLFEQTPVAKVLKAAMLERR